MIRSSKKRLRYKPEYSSSDEKQTVFDFFQSRKLELKDFIYNVLNNEIDSRECKRQVGFMNDKEILQIQSTVDINLKARLILLLQSQSFNEGKLILIGDSNIYEEMIQVYSEFRNLIAPIRYLLIFIVLLKEQKIKVSNKTIDCLFQIWLKTENSTILSCTFDFVTESTEYRMTFYERTEVIQKMKTFNLDKQILFLLSNRMEETKLTFAWRFESYLYHKFPLKKIIHLFDKFSYLIYDSKKCLSITECEELEAEFITNSIIERYLSYLSGLFSKLKRTAQQNLNLCDTEYFTGNYILKNGIGDYKDIQDIQHLFGNKSDIIIKFLNICSHWNYSLVRNWVKSHEFYINNLVFQNVWNLSKHDRFFKTLQIGYLPLWDNCIECILKQDFYSRDKYEEYPLLKEIFFQNIDLKSLLKDSIKRILFTFENFSEDFFFFEVTFLDEIAEGDGVMRQWFEKVLKELILRNFFYYEEESGTYNLNDYKDMDLEDLEFKEESVLQFVSIFFSLMFKFEYETGYRFAKHFIEAIMCQFNPEEDVLSVCIDIAKDLDPLYHRNFIKLSNEEQNEHLDDIQKRFKMESVYKNLEILESGLRNVSKHPIGWFNCINPDFWQKKLRGQENPIDVEDWISNIEFKHLKCNSKEMFLCFLRSTSDQKRLKLYQLTTSRRAVPRGGFSELSPKWTLEGGINTNVYPIARTCFHLFKIPEYLCQEKFDEKVEEFLLIDDEFTLV